MRCPTCGFISFDHLDSCRKCKKPLASLSLALHGSTYDCQAPAFLRFSGRREKTETVDDHPLANVVEDVEIEAPGLADIPNLTPPNPNQTVEGIEDKDDVDLNLDLDLGFDLPDLEQHAKSEEEKAASVADSRKEPAAPVGMDADLDFELDLAGFSLHNYGDNRK